MGNEKTTRVSLSVCLIVKNEEKNLPKCLQSVEGLADEIIVVDTGSEDGTLDVLKSFGIEPYFFTWVNDFSAAKNFSLSKATKEWVLFLDGDECLSVSDHNKIKRALEGPYDCYRLTKRSYVDSEEYLNFTPNDHSYPEGDGFLGWIPEPNDLLFRNHLGVYFEGVIHENIGSSLVKLKARTASMNVPIHHYGRHDMSKKNLLYKELVDKRLKDNWSDDQAWYYKGTHADWDGLSEIAEECFESCLSLSKNKDALFGLALSKYKLKKLDQSEELFKKYLEENPGEVLAWKNLIHISYLQQRFDKFMRYLEAYKSLGPLSESFSIFISGLFLKMGLEPIAEYYLRRPSYHKEG